MIGQNLFLKNLLLQKTFLLLAIIINSGVAQVNNILFEDKLNGELIPGWRSAPKQFVELPETGKVMLFESESVFPVNPPWAGDQSWKNYRVEIELLPTGGHWFGIDFHVQENGLEANNVQFFTFDTTSQTAIEAASIHGGYEGACSWKLYPFSSKYPVLEKGQWVKLKIDIGDSFANVYLGDMENPVHTAYDFPYSSGGIRITTIMKSKIYLRNLKITSLENTELMPLIKDDWVNVRNKNILKDWKVTKPFDAGFGIDQLPDTLISPQVDWMDIKTDSKGVINLGQKFPNNNRTGTSFAKTVIYSESEKQIKAWVSYTDRCKIWCNGIEIFNGPKRGWYDPEANHDCRLKPDNFEFTLPLKKGDNEIILRSEVTERWGWGFWMRTE